MNLVGLILMGADKLFAIKDMGRIPEKTLIGISAAGGAVGTFMGMILFRHKIRKAKFYILLPLFLVGYIALLLYLQ